MEEILRDDLGETHKNKIYGSKEKVKAVPHNNRLQISQENCHTKSQNFLLILGGLTKILPNLWGDLTRKLVARYCEVLPKVDSLSADWTGRCQRTKSNSGLSETLAMMSCVRCRDWVFHYGKKTNENVVTERKNHE